MNLRFTTRANRDLVAIGEWIAVDNPARASSFVEEIAGACRRIANFPGSYPQVHPGRPLRVKVYRRYRILFEVRVDHVLIVSVRHSARRK